MSQINSKKTIIAPSNTILRNEIPKSRINSKKIITAIVSVVLCGVIACGVLLLCPDNASSSEIDYTPDVEAIAEPIREHVNFLDTPYRQDGYENLKAYWDHLTQLKAEAEGKAEAAIAELDGWITDDEKEMLISYEEIMRTAGNMDKYNETLAAFDAVVAEVNSRIAAYVPPQTTYSYSAAPAVNSNVPSSGGGFRSQGVVNWNGTRYTYYSSNALYHYRTPEWTPNSEGFYTDSNGYLICASNDYAQGTIVDTPWGQGIVQDSGCASGTLDMYTNF